MPTITITLTDVEDGLTVSTNATEGDNKDLSAAQVVALAVLQFINKKLGDDSDTKNIDG